jgi:uncharacterized DUF497 family protein
VSAAAAPQGGVRFEWDPTKASAHLGEHGVSFEEASTVFADQPSATARDPDHARGQSRFLSFGVSSAGRVLLVPTLTVAGSSAWPVPGPPLAVKGRFMKRPESLVNDAQDMRSEYKREDWGTLVRGKYAARHARAANIVVIDDALTQAFPNSQAVNEALQRLLNVATAVKRSAARSKRTSVKRAA